MCNGDVGCATVENTIYKDTTVVSYHWYVVCVTHCVYVGSHVHVYVCLCDMNLH